MVINLLDLKEEKLQQKMEFILKQIDLNMIKIKIY